MTPHVKQEGEAMQQGQKTERGLGGLAVITQDIFVIYHQPQQSYISFPEKGADRTDKAIPQERRGGGEKALRVWGLGKPTTNCRPLKAEQEVRPSLKSVFH
ncbi:hypothetical protein CEXT_34181 [Caerostris extrusa]|uniref:Uncharacterized protein n=1 Tax=Caerostris extrusa TaxID=172846 RepID=A0AAV4PHF7_CAEEX|nr:hypothetical protein CEXT_34181 [Caerostris extrusa]